MSSGIFGDVIVTKEAKEVTLKIYPSDYERFQTVVKEINSNLKEGEVREEEVFSKMLNHALSSHSSSNKTAPKRGRKPAQQSATTKNTGPNTQQIQ